MRVIRGRMYLLLFIAPEGFRKSAVSLIATFLLLDYRYRERQWQ